MTLKSGSRICASDGVASRVYFCGAANVQKERRFHIRVLTLVHLDKQYYETEWQINMNEGERVVGLETVCGAETELDHKQSPRQQCLHRLRALVRTTKGVIDREVAVTVP